MLIAIAIFITPYINMHDWLKIEIVYSYIYHGLGKTETISEEDQSLNELATKYCSAHIKSVRAIISASKK